MSEYRKAIENLIRDILGDFPQGFNAGVVAGVPGWAGDMAYMAQEYPRALLTDTPLRPPVEYVGTTDSIAKAAGYEIPGTFSGQLGAAVGGLLSPGPGDLAKFAPLLSAIPFWHGSPHKFDAFDLSKMGTGEGAQAYGWGAYGAENKRVAQEYFDKLGEIATYVDGEKLTDPMGSPRVMAVEYLKNSPSPEYAKEYAAMMHKAGLWKNNPEQYRAVVSAIDEFAGKPVDSRIEGNLYRGEYAWPDPAKEAATPLTGEDLLQWDRPLSEQPKIVEALRKAGMWDGPGKWAEATGAKGQDLVAIMEAKKGEKGAADFLSANGIPGIRYLDGQSRDGGSGTYNYVMFDDKGIKLLERNGKPIGGLLDKKRFEDWQADAIASGKSAPVVSQGYWHPVFAGKKGSSPVHEIEFSRTPSGVSMTPKTTVSPEQLLGSALIPAYGDRTAAGLNLNSVNGVEFGEPVMLEGGPDFMRTHDAHGSAWASGKGVISALHNRMLTAAEGGRDVYMPYITMGHGASDFNTMLADTLLEQLRYGKYTKKSKKEFDDEMRKIRPDWLGIDHPNAISQLEGNGEVRRTFVDRMSLDKFVNAGFPDIGASRRAITEDSLLSVPNDMAGYSIAKLDTTAPKILEPKAPHKTYANQLAGNYFGGFEQPVPRDVMFSDWYRARRAEGKPTSADHRSFDLAKPIQIADQQWLDGVMEYLINRLDR